MFRAQAHSFTQQARLAISLSWIAGYTNALTVLTCGQVTSHLTGTISQLGVEVAQVHWRQAGYLSSLVAMFLAGAFASGVLTEFGRVRRFQSIYVLPMVVEALLLALFALLIDWQAVGVLSEAKAHVVLTWLPAFAMGLQNATITRISGGVVRTTHVTGVLTDLGLEAAQFCAGLRDRLRGQTEATPRGGPHSAMRLVLLASIMGSFALGACLGTLAHDWQPRYAMFPPVLFLLWVVYQDIAHPIAEIEPSTLVSEHLGLDDRIVVYQLVREARHRKHVRAPIHRMPNLLAWSERLPPTARVIILDLGGVTHIDHNSAMELRAVMQQLTRTGRRLILAGLSPDQVRQLRDAGLGELLRPENTCPDVELAVAQGLNGLS